MSTKTVFGCRLLFLFCSIKIRQGRDRETSIQCHRLKDSSKDIAGRLNLGQTQAGATSEASTGKAYLLPFSIRPVKRKTRQSRQLLYPIRKDLSHVCTKSWTLCVVVVDRQRSSDCSERAVHWACSFYTRARAASEATGTFN